MAEGQLIGGWAPSLLCSFYKKTAECNKSGLELVSLSDLLPDVLEG